jgi:ABC-type dipeptide/oligopeptide/nickel transport system permease component
MFKYLLSRFLTSVFLIAGIFIVVFFAVRLAAGDPALIRGGIYARQDIIEQYRKDFGTDKSNMEQLWNFLSGLPSGDFGTSFRYQEPTFDLVMQRLPNTLKLGGLSLFIVILLSAVLGVIAAVRRGSWFDQLVLALTVFGQSAPVFWVALMLVLLFSVRYQIFPAVGYAGWKSLVLPTLAIVFTELPWQLRVVRSEMIETLLQDYVRTERAYGIREPRINFMYALRNASIPWVSVMGVQAGFLLGGTIVAEVVFNYPGLGKLFLDAVTARDYPLVQSITIITASLFVFLNFFVDVLYSIIDPRIRSYSS